MSHGILLQIRQMISSVRTPIIPAIYNRGLLLEDSVMAIGDQQLGVYPFNTLDRNDDACSNRLILRETS